MPLGYVGKERVVRFELIISTLEELRPTELDDTRTRATRQI